MNILLLNPAAGEIKNTVKDLAFGCWCAGKRIGGTRLPPLALLQVATVLQEAGNAVTLLDAEADPEGFRAIKPRTRDFQAVILSSCANSFREDVEVLRELKTINPDIVSMVFGPHPTFMPEYCLREECIDIIIRREPECIVRDVIAAIRESRPWQDIRGIGYRNNDRALLNAWYPFIEPLDSLPPPDWTLLPEHAPYFNPLAKKTPFATVQTSRGCNGTCTFCTAPSFYGGKVRWRSAKSVLREIRTLCALGYKEILFRDENFTTHTNRNREICAGMIEEGTDIPWMCNSRADTISQDDIRLMKKAGCHMIKFGVETGNAEILEAMHKDITLQQTRACFKLCHAAGVDTHAHIMLGCPGETRATIAKTLSFVKEISPTTVSFGIYTPLAGTRLFEELSRELPEIGDGSAVDMERIHIQAPLNERFTSLSRQELENAVHWAYRAFYLRPAYLLKRLAALRRLDEWLRWMRAGNQVLRFAVEGRLRKTHSGRSSDSLESIPQEVSAQAQPSPEIPERSYSG